MRLVCTICFVGGGGGGGILFYLFFFFFFVAFEMGVNDGGLMRVGFRPSLAASGLKFLLPRGGLSLSFFPCVCVCVRAKRASVCACLCKQGT